MIRNVLILSALFAAPAFAAEPAVEPAATLSAQQGTVLVNQGDEFVTATDAQVLLAGDRVMVMEGGSAELTFVDGCVFPLAAGSLLDVPAVSPCAGTVANVETIGPSYAAALGRPGDGSAGRGSRGTVTTFAVFSIFTAIIAEAVINGELKFRDGVMPAPPSP